MNAVEANSAVLESAENGIITSEKVTEMGIHRSAISALVKSGEIVKCSRGVYMLKDEWEDEFFLLQHKYKKGIFSHSTALYLWRYSERVPLKLHMTFPTNYNSQSLSEENVEVTSDYDDFYIAVKTEVIEQIDTAKELIDIIEKYCNMRID